MYLDVFFQKKTTRPHFSDKTSRFPTNFSSIVAAHCFLLFFFCCYFRKKNIFFCVGVEGGGSFATGRQKKTKKKNSLKFPKKKINKIKKSIAFPSRNSTFFFPNSDWFVDWVVVDRTSFT